MKIERTKNASRNIVFGVILKIYTLAVPFLIRTLMIYFMGVEYLGLNSLFTSILQVLNLTELGVGSAMVYSMYKPIVDDDKEKICQLMRLYRTYYRVIGLVIAVVGCILIPFIPNLIAEDSLATLPPEINVYILYGLNLAATVLTYWLFAYKNCLLNAHQRNDVSSKISIVITTLQYGLQIVAIIFGNYYIYVIVALATQALNNVITALITTKMYPDYKPVGKMPKSEIKNINRRILDLFTSKIGGTVTNSFDTIVVSTFLGLTVLAIYQNYFYIVTAIIGMIYIIFNSCTAGIGNSIISETKEKNYNDFKKFTLLTMWIVAFCTSCFLCLFQPFMQVWVGEELMLGFSFVILLCIYFVFYEMNAFFSLFKDAAGAWHEDRWRPLTSSLANLVMNLIFVQFWGLYGVILSTIISQAVISIPWLLYNLFTTIYDKKDFKAYVTNIIVYLFVIILVSGITYVPCYFINFDNAWVTFFIRLVVCCIVPNAIFIILYHKTVEFKEVLGLINRITRGKIKFLRKYENLPQPVTVNVTGQQSSVNVQSDMVDIEQPVEAKLLDDNSQLPESVNIKSEQDTGSTENDPNRK